jgi:hypothetical protein
MTTSGLGFHSCDTRSNRPGPERMAGGRETKLSAAHDGVAVIKPGQTYIGKQGFIHSAGASAETVGAEKI